MIYSALVFPAMLTGIKRSGHLLLPLTLCVLLIGCDNHSSASSTDDNAINKTEPKTGVIGNTATDTQQNYDVDSNDNVSDADQSLLATAKSNESERIRRTPMISESNSNSALQATLMGDYSGNLPCAFCAGIHITLNLFADGSVLKTSIYDDSEALHASLIEPGIYRQDKNTITIVYDNKNIETYRIQDNHLVMIDKNDKPNADYTLSRK